MADYDFQALTTGQTLSQIDSDWVQITGTLDVNTLSIGSVKGLAASTSPAAYYFNAADDEYDQKLKFVVSDVAYLVYIKLSLHYSGGNGGSLDAGNGYQIYPVSATNFHLLRDGAYVLADQLFGAALLSTDEIEFKSTEQVNGDLLLEVLVNDIQRWSYTELSANKLPVGSPMYRAETVYISLKTLTVEPENLSVNADFSAELASFDFSATASALISADLSAELSSFDFSAAATVAYPPGGFLHAELASFDFDADATALIQGAMSLDLSGLDFTATALLGRQCDFNADLSGFDLQINAGLGRIASFNPVLSGFGFELTALLGRIASLDIDLAGFSFTGNAGLGRIASLDLSLSDFSMHMLLGNTFPTDICMAPVGSGSSISNNGGSQFDFTVGGGVKRRAYYDESVTLSLLVPAATVLQRQLLDDFHAANELTKFFIDIPFDRSGSTRAYRVAFKEPPLPVDQVADRCGIKIELIGNRY